MKNSNEEPEKKRLRQSSIFECFEKLSPQSHEKTIKNYKPSTENEQTDGVMETTQKKTRNVMSENPTCSTLLNDDSPPLFSSDTSNGDTSSTERCSLGVPLSTLQKTPEYAPMLPQLQSSSNHTVLFKTDSKFDVPPKPSLESYTDIWDENYVRMPCSPNNMYPVEDAQNHKVVESRWDLIRKSLTEKIRSSYDLQVMCKNHSIDVLDDFVIPK